MLLTTFIISLPTKFNIFFKDVKDTFILLFTVVLPAHPVVHWIGSTKCHNFITTLYVSEMQQIKSVPIADWKSGIGTQWENWLQLSYCVVDRDSQSILLFGCWLTQKNWNYRIKSSIGTWTLLNKSLVIDVLTISNGQRFRFELRYLLRCKPPKNSAQWIRLIGIKWYTQAFQGTYILFIVIKSVYQIKT